MTYGINYQGSKNAIAKEILSFLPDGKRLVDLFGGGGAISHCACLSDKYQEVLYNEKNKFLCDGIRKAITEGFEKEVRWVSREEFHALKNTDFYVASCFSFSGNFINYLYSEDLEPIKKRCFLQKFIMTTNYTTYSKLYNAAKQRSYANPPNKRQRVMCVHNATSSNSYGNA